MTNRGWPGREAPSVSTRPSFRSSQRSFPPSCSSPVSPEAAPVAKPGCWLREPCQIELSGSGGDEAGVPEERLDLAHEGRTVGAHLVLAHLVVGGACGLQ